MGSKIALLIVSNLIESNRLRIFFPKPLCDWASFSNPLPICLVVNATRQCTINASYTGQKADPKRWVLGNGY